MIKKDITLETPLSELEQEIIFSMVENGKITKENVKEKIIELENQSKYTLALELVRRYKPKDVTVTKGTLKKEYGLKNTEIEKMTFLKVDNPHFSSAAPMKLYLKSEAKKIIQETLN